MRVVLWSCKVCIDCQPSMWTHFYLCQSRHHIWRRGWDGCQVHYWTDPGILSRLWEFRSVRGASWTFLHGKRYTGREKGTRLSQRCMGPTYRLLRNLLAPANPKDKSFNTLQASILFLNLFLQSRRQPSPPKQHTGKYTFCAARVLRNDCCLKQTWRSLGRWK